MTTFNNRTHIPEEECHKQRRDMATVNVSIGHNHNTMITQAAHIKRIADTDSHALYQT